MFCWRNAARPRRPFRPEIRRVGEPSAGGSRRACAQGGRRLSRRQALHHRRPDLRAAGAPHYTSDGLASWYGEDFHGRATANGEIYDMASISAAHPTLPIPSYARVTNLANGKSIIVRVNDRGPYHANRLIDVSVRTAKLLGFYDHGITRVRVDYVGRAALEGSDDTKLAATLRTGSPAPGPAEVRLASPHRRGCSCRNRPSRCAAACQFRPIAPSISATTRPTSPSPGTSRKIRSPQSAASRSRRLWLRRRSPRRPPGPRPRPRHVRRKAPSRTLRYRTNGSGDLPAVSLRPTVSESVPAASGPVSAFAGPPPSGGAIVSGRGLY